MRIGMQILLYIMLILSFSFSQSRKSDHHASQTLNCKECHTCDSPTYEKPCLKVFPDFIRRKGITVYHTAKDVAEIIKIDIISNLYEPTIFTHKLHAEMSDMAGGCIFCHHHNPPGRIAPCRECHQEKTSGTDLEKPGLKGAFHRQCLSCHREWGHSNDCSVCHALQGDTSAVISISEKSRFKKIEHPTVVEPTVVIYETNEPDEGPLVSFYHDNHSRNYALKCVDCHQEESCSRCHGNQSKKITKENDLHSNCMFCHKPEIDNNCKYCHDFKRRKRFDHTDTDFSLAKHHNSLECQSCHKTKNNINRQKPKKDCLACHQSWLNSSFNHRVTGFILDEDHVDNACEDCHSNNNFAAKPSCSECHDDLNYPAHKPGKKLNY